MSSRRERTQKSEQGQEREQEEVRQPGRQRPRAVRQGPGARSVRPAASASGHPGGPAVAPGARQWLTLVGRKRVLAVVHTVTYAKRLLEVLSLLAADFRVQVVFTAPPHAFGSEVPRFLAELNSAVIPWEDVRHQSFDLALAAGPQGLAHVRAPLIALPHGANYLKRIVGPSDGPEAGVPGLRRSDIMPGGRELPAALVVPHRDELAALARSCPEALAVTEVVGDPAHDRITAGLTRRTAYRRALGIHDGQKLVVVASTWGPRSSFGRIEALLPRLIGELPGGPGGTFRTAVLVHPNVWSGHGAWQVRAWLTQFGRYGISVLPPEADWRSVLVAADWIIGDHGSVTLYGTLTPAPILLTGSDDEEINPASPAATLALTAPVLSPAPPLADQLAYAASEYDREEYAAIAARISSEPGRFHRNMRRLMYRVLGLGRPAYEPGTEPLPLPPPLSTWAGMPSGGAGQEPA